MTTVEHIVMTRVHRIHVLRRVFNATACKMYGLALFVAGLLSTVSVASVYANTPSITDPSAFGSYLLNALLGTEWIVQLLVLGMLVAGVMLVLDLVRGSSNRVVLPFARV